MQLGRSPPRAFLSSSSPSLLPSELLAAFLADPVYEVKRKDGKRFLQATKQQILTLLAYRALEPKRLETGKINAWKLIKPIQQVRTILKSERGRLDAEGNHTVRRVKAPIGSYYEHRMEVCAGYRR
jgi:hypothetical protein